MRALVHLTAGHRQPRRLTTALAAFATLAVTFACAGTANAFATPFKPVIRTMSPTTMRTVGGGNVTFTGHFYGAYAVTFGGVRATLRYAGTRRLVFTAPPHPAGTVAVRVLTRGGKSHPSRVTRFRYTPVPPPTLATAAPTLTLGPLPTPIVPDDWSGPNPTANCTAGVVGCGVTVEGLQPPPLPANWKALTNVQQAFVLLTLERVERGETPLLGISQTLNQYARQGAAVGDDPDGPDQIGGNWDSQPDSVASIPDYLYNDGPGSFNLACQGAQMWGCWGHRDDILQDPTDPTLSVGLANGQNGSTESFGDTLSDFVFTWAQELTAGYPQGLPTSYTLTPATLTSVTVSDRDKTGAATLTLHGAGLDTVTAVYLSGFDVGAPDCHASCWVGTGGRLHLAPNTTYSVYAVNPAGLSERNPAATYTTAPAP